MTTRYRFIEMFPFTQLTYEDPTETALYVTRLLSLFTPSFLEPQEAAQGRRAYHHARPNYPCVGLLH